MKTRLAHMPSIAAVVMLLCAPAPRRARAEGLALLPDVSLVPMAPVEETDIGTLPLDSLPRELGGHGRLRCPRIELVRYAGDVIRYRGGVLVHPAFRDRLRRFEEVVQETAIDFYGRPPSSMRLLGSYVCRRIRHIDGLISEHALGDAIDVAELEFPPSDAVAANTDPRLGRAFRVSVARDWSPSQADPVRAVHSRFLHALIARLLATPHLFRVLIGPADPDHWNHFHLDCAPYRYVRI